MITGFESGDHLRNFDTTNFAVTYRGDVYFLRPIIDAIRNLWQKAMTEEQKPHWQQ